MSNSKFNFMQFQVTPPDSEEGFAWYLAHYGPDCLRTFSNMVNSFTAIIVNNRILMNNRLQSHSSRKPQQHLLHQDARLERQFFALLLGMKCMISHLVGECQGYIKLAQLAFHGYGLHWTLSACWRVAHARFVLYSLPEIICFIFCSQLLFVGSNPFSETSKTQCILTFGPTVYLFRNVASGHNEVYKYENDTFSLVSRGIPMINPTHGGFGFSFPNNSRQV